MKRAALFISSLHRAGAERVLCQIAEHLCAQGIEVTVVTQYEDPDSYSLSPGIRRRVSDLTPEETGRSRAGNLIRRFRKLRRIWREERPDVILSFIGKNNVMAVLTARGVKTAAGRRVPVACAVRGDPAEEYPAGSLRRAAFAVFPMAEGIVLQTERSRAFFPEKIRKKCTVLPNPISAAFIRPRFEGEREKRIVAVGRIDANKQQAMMVRAFRRIADGYPDWQLVLIGDGPDREALMRGVREMTDAQVRCGSPDAAAARPWTERILFPGSIADVPEAIRRAAVFVLASDTEGMPNALLEAMSLGLACISTDCPCGGPAQLIEDGVNGLLVPVRDEEALASAMRRLIEDPALAERLGAAAQRVQEIYAPARALGAWEEYLSGLADGRTGRGAGASAPREDT